MAIDGVAPRAKMNQQRSRRFRTAQEAKELRDKALAKGEDLPDTAPFDSNCITPGTWRSCMTGDDWKLGAGTLFMAKLSEQLKYFVAKKVNEDSDWRSVQVVLSGHEVPGEGEHKIMEYIRLAKAQPDYNPNMRHCLYGLDADLIMLGLLSHDPHFCLLREEVVFGPQRKKSKGTLETQNFYLMHLSLFREYLDLEFSSLAETPNLGFEYDLERIIDDWILLVIFVGNDFLPHLPGLHIQEGALNLLYRIYKKVLPKAGGYLNEHGQLNTRRLQLVLDELCHLEQDEFEMEYADSNWFKGKQHKHVEALEQARTRAKLALTSEQRKLFQQIKGYVQSAIDHPTEAGTLYFPAKYPARDRRFLQDVASELRLSIAFDEFNEQDEPVIALRLDEEMVDLMQADGLADDIDGFTIDGESTSGQEGEWKQAIDRVLNKYDKAPTLPDHSESDIEDQYQAKLKEKMDTWKREYYKVRLVYSLFRGQSEILRRTRCSWITATRSSWVRSSSATSKACNGSCTTTTTVWQPGAGSTIITIRRR
jgi:5'-3' exoribonuclease 1